jgi:hypothetical protein
MLVLGVAALAVVTLSRPAEPVFQRDRAGVRDRGEREVPNRFRKLYRELAGLLDRFNASVGDRRGRGGSVVLGGEVLPANAHRGPGLLDDKSAFPGSVMYIDRLKDLGAGGVSISLSYPLMTDNYPRSAEYWSFYKRLTDEVRKRGLKLHIKTGPMFTEKEFTDVKTDYSKLDAPTYFREKMRMNQRISEELRPDYLSIGNEPSSEMQIMKLKFTANDYTRYISDSLRSMNRRGVLVGAGTGNWDSTEYVTKFARETDLDYIDIHVYPLASRRDDYLQRAVEMARIARSARKRLVIGECWLYKAAPGELNANPTAASVFARDVYSFFAPLDSEFLEAMTRLGRAEGIEYISPFWTKYFFAYVDFGKTGLFAGPKQKTAQADKAMVAALMANRYSPTGEAYRRLARENR